MLRSSVALFDKSLTLVNTVRYSVAATREKWDLITAVCLERKPIVTPEPNTLERDFQKLLFDLEFENSLKSDHELQHEQDLKYAELLKKGADIDPDATLKQTAQDVLDAYNEELAQFKPAERVTDADRKNDVTSLNRKLDRSLLLLVNQKLGKNCHFLPPQGLWQEGETLRQTAERVLSQSCGPNIKAQFYGNSPSGFYKYKYPKDVRQTNNTVGAKLFIYWARYKEGQLSDNGLEAKWLENNELREELPMDYYKSIRQFLIV